MPSDVSLPGSDSESDVSLPGDRAAKRQRLDTCTCLRNCIQTVSENSYCKSKVDEFKERMVKFNCGEQNKALRHLLINSWFSGDETRYAWQLFGQHVCKTAWLGLLGTSANRMNKIISEINVSDSVHPGILRAENDSHWGTEND